MADESGSDQEKTESPTPKRREEARKRGQVAKSQEFASVAVLLTCCLVLYFGASGMLKKMMNLMQAMLRNAGHASLNADTVYPFFSHVLYESFLILFPLFLSVFIAALIANYFQVGFMISYESLQPKLSKINPIKGLKRLVSIRAVVELIKNVFKITVVGLVVYWTIRGELQNFIPLADESIGGLVAYTGSIALKIIFRTCLILIVLALLDYIYQRWEFEKNLKMTKQEIKDEHKQAEGDPAVRARIRRLQREAARKRMMENVPKADVIITNPTHIAVALAYQQGKMAAPTVLAKGTGFIAEKIREIARENKIPVIENKPLAQLLYKTVRVDEAIPPSLYRAVAEVLAYVYKMKAQRMR